MLHKYLVFLLSCFTLVYSQSNDMDDEIESRIIYGSAARIKDHPYFAGLQCGCGAAILSDSWLMTAAHCVENTANGIAYVGGERIDNSIPLWYDEVVTHPDYNETDWYSNDIALLHLLVPLTFTKKIRPIQLPTTQVTQKYPLLLLGRGLNENDKLSHTLMKLTLEELSPKNCMKYSTNWALVDRSIATDKNRICTRRAGSSGPTACFGDSGSPLVQNDAIIGVTSFLIKLDHQSCRDAGLTFFVRVSSYLPWINSVTGLY